MSVPITIINTTAKWDNITWIDKYGYPFKQGNTDWQINMSLGKDNITFMSDTFTLALLKDGVTLGEITDEYYTYADGKITIDGAKVFVAEPGVYGIYINIDCNVSCGVKYKVVEGVSCDNTFDPLPQFPDGVEEDPQFVAWRTSTFEPYALATTNTIDNLTSRIVVLEGGTSVNEEDPIFVIWRDGDFYNYTLSTLSALDDVRNRITALENTTDVVTSVNLKVGNVLLTASDIMTTVNGGNWNLDQATNIMWNRLNNHDSQFVDVSSTFYDTNVRIDDLGVRVTTAESDIVDINDRIDNLPSGGGVTRFNGETGDIYADGTTLYSGYDRPVEGEAGYTIFEEFEIINTELETLATNEYVNNTFLPATDLPNVLAQTEVSSLADVNFDKTKTTFQLPYLNPITGQMEAVDLVSESLNYNNILVHPVVGPLPFGANDVTFNTTPEELNGVIFTPTSTGVRITQPTNDIQLSARLKLIGNNIDPSHSVYVNIELMKNNDVIAQRGTTISNNSPVESVIDNMNINANLNDLIHIRVSYYNNGNNSTLSLDGTGYIRLYNANENAIKIPNKQLQEDYYTDGTVINTTLTSTNQTIISKLVTDSVIVNPHDISGRFLAVRSGGGTSGILYFAIYKNGVQINEDYQYNMNSGDNFTVSPQNVRRFSVNAGDTLSVQTRYVGSGTVNLNSGTYSILGRKL